MQGNTLERLRYFCSMPSNKLHIIILFLDFFQAVVSICWSVCGSVGWSVGRSAETSMPLSEHLLSIVCTIYGVLKFLTFKTVFCHAISLLRLLSMLESINKVVAHYYHCKLIFFLNLSDIKKDVGVAK